VAVANYNAARIASALSPTDLTKATALVTAYTALLATGVAPASPVVPGPGPADDLVDAAAIVADHPDTQGATVTQGGVLNGALATAEAALAGAIVTVLADPAQLTAEKAAVATAEAALAAVDVDAIQVLSLTHLDGDVNVTIDGAQPPPASEDNGLANGDLLFQQGDGNLTMAQAAGDELSLTIRGDLYKSTITVDDFGTVNLSLVDKIVGTASADTYVDAYIFALDFDVTTTELVVAGSDDAAGSTVTLTGIGGLADHDRPGGRGKQGDLEPGERGRPGRQYEHHDRR